MFVLFYHADCNRSGQVDIMLPDEIGSSFNADVETLSIKKTLRND